MAINPFIIGCKKTIDISFQKGDSDIGYLTIQENIIILPKIRIIIDDDNFTTSEKH